MKRDRYATALHRSIDVLLLGLSAIGLLLLVVSSLLH